ncbi:hypothetical protein BDR06DRAFT_971968 [Suillus hirtellus]|nr:hypothetical protein BDR06DRAFT_971968 [Suillus hirtellus]
MTVMYLGVRYIGMIYTIICVLVYVPTISVTDAGCHIMSDAIEYINDVANIMLGEIQTYADIPPPRLSGYKNRHRSDDRNNGEVSYEFWTTPLYSSLHGRSSHFASQALKHFREKRQQSSEGIIMDCFTVLMKTHVTYFASFVALTCIELIGYLSPKISAMFVLGPRLILSIREYHARLVAQSDAATAVTSIGFQESVSVN